MNEHYKGFPKYSYKKTTCEFSSPNPHSPGPHTPQHVYVYAFFLVRRNASTRKRKRALSRVSSGYLACLSARARGKVEPSSVALKRTAPAAESGERRVASPTMVRRWLEPGMETGNTILTTLSSNDTNVHLESLHQPCELR